MYSLQQTGRLLARAARLPASRGVLARRQPAAAFSSVIKVTVDGKEVEIPQGATVLYACEEAGVEIPRFCYHDRLSIAGNCRMCLVDVEKSPKPVASCAMPAMPGMNIRTGTDIVKKAREGVMEFLLANHPLDCPICDQGGECDLQDQSIAYGSPLGRYREIKRSVEDKYIGPLVKTQMTRCIHCTRCIRFGEEVAGVSVLGATGRGNNMEIGTYVPKIFDTELSGNVIDLCPVGALTSMPYAFTARPWELKDFESVDVMDGVGTNIQVSTRGPHVMRIIPRLNEDVNEIWLADKGRFSYDGLKRQRLDTPMIRPRYYLPEIMNYKRTEIGQQRQESELKEASKNGDHAVPVGWDQVLLGLRHHLKGVRGKDIYAVAGDTACVESMTLLRDLMHRLGSPNLLNHADGVHLDADVRALYAWENGIASIDEADAILVVGSNPRMEAALVAARMRKVNKQNDTPVFMLGPKVDLAMEQTYLGDDSAILAQLAQGKAPKRLQKAFDAAERPLVLVGLNAYSHQNSRGIMKSLDAMKEKFPNLVNEEWNGVGVLHTTAARVGAQDIGFVPGPNSDADLSKAKVVYLLNADDPAVIAKIPKDAFVIYQGHHGDNGAGRADVILPGAAYTEKSGTYVNMEGRPQRTIPATSTPGEARPDWTIIRALSEVLEAGEALPVNTLDEVRERMYRIAPHLEHADVLQQCSFRQASHAAGGALLKEGKDGGFSKLYKDYFLTNPIARSSRTMARSSKELHASRNNYAQPQQKQQEAAGSQQ